MVYAKEHSKYYKIIVATDDFGKNECTNIRTLKLINKGKIDRVAVMIKREISDEEIKKLKASRVKLDLHLDLLYFRRRRADYGNVKRSLGFLWDYFRRKWSAKKVEKEWEAQIEMFKKRFGFYPHGFNSHEYVHFFPPYFKIMCRLSQKYNIPYVRFGEKGIVRRKNTISRVLSILRSYNYRRYKKANCKSSDYFMSLDWTKNLSRLLRNFPKGKTEIVCHPEIKEEFKIIMKYF